MQVGVAWSGEEVAVVASTRFRPVRQDHVSTGGMLFPMADEPRSLGEVRHQTTHRDIRVQVFAFPDRDAKSLGPNGSIPMIRNWHSPAWPAKSSRWPDGLKKTNLEKRSRPDRLGTPVVGVEWIAGVQ